MLDKTFLPFQLIHGQIAEMTDDVFPTRVLGWHNDTLELREEGTHFGYVYKTSSLETNAGTFELRAGMYFSTPHSGRISGSGHGIVITRLDFSGMFTIGGPVEPQGRLKYIDGCTDSLLIPPPKLGDPCLNALYFPAHISQTEHTHPSVRVGLVARGAGECHTAEGKYTLSPGLAFIIRADGLHGFRTTIEEMVIIAYHPDSDFGPTDEAHPMINRTIVRGVSAWQNHLIRSRQNKQR